MKLPGKYCGVDIKIHISTWLLAALVFDYVASMMISKLHLESTFAIVSGSIFVSFAFLASILFHELGHVFVGSRLGVKFESVTLFILGGAAKMSGPIPNPKAEFFGCLAGPMVNIVIGGPCTYFGFVLPESALSMSLALIGIINLLIGGFNLLPAFPMDGGRMLRSAIWWITNKKLLSTIISGRIGQVFGGALVLSGILAVIGIHIPFMTESASGGIWNAFIGALIIVFAAIEISAVQKTSNKADDMVARLKEDGFIISKEEAEQIKEMHMRLSFKGYTIIATEKNGKNEFVYEERQ